MSITNRPEPSRLFLGRAAILLWGVSRLCLVLVAAAGVLEVLWPGSCPGRDFLNQWLVAIVAVPVLLATGVERLARGD